jgi:hypothetical protein
MSGESLKFLEVLVAVEFGDMFTKHSPLLHTILPKTSTLFNIFELKLNKFTGLV